VDRQEKRVCLGNGRARGRLPAALLSSSEWKRWKRPLSSSASLARMGQLMGRCPRGRSAETNQRSSVRPRPNDTCRRKSHDTQQPHANELCRAPREPRQKRNDVARVSRLRRNSMKLVRSEESVRALSRTREDRRSRSFIKYPSQCYRGTIRIEEAD
jgi:hypothetical protein